MEGSVDSLAKFPFPEGVEPGASSAVNYGAERSTENLDRYKNRYIDAKNAILAILDVLDDSDKISMLNDVFCGEGMQA